MIYDAAHANEGVRTKPDFALINTGTFRTTWLPGELFYKDVYGMIPFDNQLVTFRIIGASLETLIEVIHKGGWTYGFRNLKVKMTRNPWKVLEVSTSSGESLEPDKWYIGATTDFLLKGGDGFKDLINTLFLQEHIEPFGSFRDQTGKQVFGLGVITSGRYDPRNPRMEFADDLSSDL